MGRPAIVHQDPTPLDDEELVARLFRALGDASRLSILEFLLESGTVPQKTLVAHVGLSQGQVSQHLACLTWCGFIDARKRGREVLYSIASPRAGALVDLGRLFLDATHGDIGSCRIVTDLAGVHTSDLP